MNSRPEISVLIPTFNAVGQVDKLLGQLVLLRERIEGGLQIVVTDDASRDETVRHVRSSFPGITVVEHESNAGFGGNVNSGAGLVEGYYLVLLNSDVELVGDPLTVLIDLLRSDPRVFAAMPLIFNTALQKIENLSRLYCHRGLCWHTGLPEEARYSRRQLEEVEAAVQKDHRSTHAPVESVLCGAAFACRTADFRALGGFDPRYRPFYWEDVDLGYRAARLAQRCVTVPAPVVIHRHSESIGREHGERKLRFLLRNQLRFVQAHADQLRGAGLKSERWWWALRAIRALASGDLEFARAYMGAAIDLSD